MTEPLIPINEVISRLSARQVGLELVVGLALGGMYQRGQLAPKFLDALRIARDQHHKRAGVDAEEIAAVIDRMIDTLTGAPTRPARPLLTLIDGGKSGENA